MVIGEKQLVIFLCIFSLASSIHIYRLEQLADSQLIKVQSGEDIYFQATGSITTGWAWSIRNHRKIRENGIISPVNIKDNGIAEYYEDDGEDGNKYGAFAMNFTAKGPGFEEIQFVHKPHHLPEGVGEDKNSIKTIKIQVYERDL